MSKDKDLTQKIFDYIALLEKTNDELIFTLKRSVELLSQFKEMVSDPQVAGYAGCISRDDKDWGEGG